MTLRHAHAVVLLAGMIAATATCDRQKPPTEPTPVCTITITPANATFENDGGSGTVTVAVAAGCPWTAASSAGWITVTGGATGTGPGTVTYAVTANSATNSRDGSLMIGGQSHAIRQLGAPPVACTYDVAPAGADFSKDASIGTFTVTTAAGCAWTTVSHASWVTVTSNAERVGSGDVTYAVSRNNDTGERRSDITVANRMFTIRQSGDSGACQYSVAPVDVRPCMPGGTLTATVTTQPFCPWTAASNASWLNVSEGASGSGSGVISFGFSDNYDAPRQGIIMVRWPTPTEGQNIHVAQAGCLYAVSRSAFSFATTGGSDTFDVIQQSDPNTCGGATQDRCVWTARSDVPWITITTSMPRAGDNPVGFAVAANDAAGARVGTITVRDKVVTITQAGR
jgi:hypothetical protein